MSESEDTEESENSNQSINRLRHKLVSKPIPKSWRPNVTQFKPHFIPGKAFSRKNRIIRSDTYVRKRKNSIGSFDLDQNNDTSSNKIGDNCNDWRNGPAKYWYDLINLPNDCDSCDYGFKLKSSSVENSFGSISDRSYIDSEDAFHLVSQTNWEKEVIWDGDRVRQKVMKVVDKPSIAGWIPIEENRKAPEFVKQLKTNLDNNNMMKNLNNSDVINNNVCDANRNNSCINGRDSSRKLQNKKVAASEKHNNSEKENEQTYEWVSSLPEENRELVLNRWEDQIIWDYNAMDRIPSPKIVPFNEGDDNMILTHVLDEDTNNCLGMGETFKTSAINFNISNDEYYASVSKADNNSPISVYIVHSIPALRLHLLYFPTYVKDHNHFYRPLLKRSKILSKSRHDVLLCIKQIKLKEKLCESERHALRDMSHFLIKNPKDLTACNGDIILMEYSEEDPPLLMRNGMGSKIINYFKKKNVGDTCSAKNFKYGETKQISNSPFIGDLSPGQSQQAIETNMFRAPIFEHSLPETDFLVIRTTDSFYIRPINALYVVGQELPLIEVPRPRSKNWFEFIKRFAKIFIHRLFENRKSIKNLGTHLKKAFPDMSQHMIYKCLKDYTERQGDHHVLKSEIPVDDQINCLVTPEECCAYYSAAIAEQKLKERGYGDRLYLMSEENNLNDNSLDEVSEAPWNTTRAYIASLNSIKWLNLSEYNEDASLVYSIKSYKDFKDQIPTIKKCKPVSLRTLKRMSLKSAHEWLINYGMSREKVKKLKNRFECTNLIKELSEKLIQSGVTANMSKTSTAEQHYKYECQKIFNLQTSIYSSKEDFSTDEEEEDEECNSELEDMGKDLEAMFLQNKTSEELDFEREEAERLDFIKSLNAENSKLTNGNCKESYEGKILKITRTYECGGKSYSRTEFVRKPEVIEAYVRIRKTKNQDFIKRLSLVGNHTENENRVLNKSKVSDNKLKTKSNTKVVKEAPKLATEITKVVEEVQNNSFEMNKNSQVNGFNDSSCDLSELPEEENEELVRVDGFKLRFNKKVIDDAIKIQMEEKRLEIEKREAERNDFNVEYYQPRKTQRCRIDPMVKLKDIFDQTILEVRKLQVLDENIDIFMTPVNKKEVPDYYEIIENPMDLMTMRKKIAEGKYTTRREFLSDIELIYLNSVEYSGAVHEYTRDAKILLEFCVKKFIDMDEELSHLENEINPILANDQTYRLAFIFDSVIAIYKQIREIEPLFDMKCKPLYKNHVNQIINLNMIAKKSKEKQYKSIEAFMTDLELLRDYTIKSFGPNHDLSKIANKQILMIARTTIDQFLDKFKTYFPNLAESHFAFKSRSSSCSNIDSNPVDENISNNFNVEKDLELTDEESSRARKKLCVAPLVP